MHELIKLTLENEMDLMLVHRRSMKLGELTGLSISAQTTFATAVSEVARNTIESGRQGRLTLSIDSDQRDKYIVACITDSQVHTSKVLQKGLEYAKRLVNKYNVSSTDTETSIELFYYILPNYRIDIFKLDEWRTLFRNEPPVSPYDELKRKTEQLQELSEKVQKSEAQYKTLTNALPLIIFSVDLHGNLLYANEGLYNFTGSNINMLNQNGWEEIVHKEDYYSFNMLFNSEVAKGTTTIRTQSRLRSKDGEEYFWHQVSLSPFKDEKGELQYWIGFMVDIHAQKMFEQTLQSNRELKDAQKELKENQKTLEGYVSELNRSNAELEQFAFATSHDLQEPVRKLIFYSDYLLNKGFPNIDDKATSYLQHIKSASLRMRNLIRDILQFSQSNAEEVKFQLVDLNQVAQEAIEDLQILIEEKEADITISSFPSVRGDHNMLRQVFENILGNALKYSHEGVKPKISITHSVMDEGLSISFQDNGIGFHEKFSEQIFLMFQRLHSREQHEGTGIGLSICRKILALHSGTITAKSKEGAGSIFTVVLPNDLIVK